MFFTIKSFIGKYSETSLSKDVLANLAVLQDRMNKLHELYHKNMVVTSGYRSMEDHLRIYKEKGITDKTKIPMKSKHLFGQAVDISDKDGFLWDWCKKNEWALEQCELWCEDDPGTPRVHFQIVPPNSGHRFFKP